MADKFLNTGGSGNADISNGTATIFGATIGADNLNVSKPLKTNSSKQLISTNLDIADINSLQTELSIKPNLTLIKNDVQDDPAPNGIKIYAKSDGSIYQRDSNGTESVFGGASNFQQLYDSSVPALITEIVNKPLILKTGNLDTDELFACSNLTGTKNIIMRANGELDLQKLKSITGNIEFELDDGNFNLTSINNSLTSTGYTTIVAGTTFDIQATTATVNSNNIITSLGGDNITTTLTTSQTNFTQNQELTTKKYVDDAVASGGGGVDPKTQNISATPGNTYIDGNLEVSGDSPFVLALGGVGVSSSIKYSTDSGDTWTAITPSTFSNEARAAAYGGGRWVAVGLDLTSSIYYSDDGINWTAVAFSPFSYGFAVGYGNGLFVALGSLTAGNTIASSTDGINWSGRGNTMFSTSGRSCLYNDKLGIWVAGGLGNNCLAWSLDGINWNQSLTGNLVMSSVYSIIYDGDKFIAGGIGTTNLAQSVDGKTWTVFNFDGNFVYSIAYGVINGNGAYVTAGADGPGTPFRSSPDGTSWFACSGTTSLNGEAVTFTGGKFFITGQGGDIQSGDGVNFSTVETGIFNDGFGFATKPAGNFSAVDITAQSINVNGKVSISDATTFTDNELVPKKYVDGINKKYGSKAELIALTGMVAGDQFYMIVPNENQKNKLWTYSGRTWQVIGETVELVCSIDVIEGNTIEVSTFGDFQLRLTNSSQDLQCIGVVALKSVPTFEWATVACRGTWEVACKAGTYNRASYLNCNTTDGLAQQVTSVTVNPFAKILENITNSTDEDLVWAIIHAQEIY